MLIHYLSEYVIHEMELIDAFRSNNLIRM